MRTLPAGFSRLAAVALVAAVGAQAAPAGATTLTFFGSVSNAPAGPNSFTYDANDDRGSLTCSGTCEGLLSNLASGVYTTDTLPDATTAAGFSSSADLFDLDNSSVASETDFVNAVTGSSFATGTKTDPGLVNFISSAEYILFKIGTDPDYALIHNTSANNTFDYSAFIREGAGLSHFTEFGTVAAIPLPAALPLFLTVLGGFGFLGWRRQTAMA